MFELSGKTAFVTGAGSGIGEAIAYALAGARAFVYVADIDIAAGTRVVSALNERGGEAEFINLDVSDKQQCNAAAAGVLALRGPVDILVNNAGVGHVGTILDTETEDLERLFAV